MFYNEERKSRMPPKVKITREMILNAALGLTREQGFEAVNARNIAAELECSTRPIFTAYQNMEEMDEKTFQLYLKYHLATCEREDLLGITSHAVDIFQKQ